jgi:pimeloyl-ACP methyl ester carboxylesterase
MRRGLAGSVLEHRTATVLFDAGTRACGPSRSGTGGAGPAGELLRPLPGVQGSLGTLADVGVRVAPRASRPSSTAGSSCGATWPCRCSSTACSRGRRPAARARPQPQVTRWGCAPPTWRPARPTRRRCCCCTASGATNASMLPVLADLAVDHRVLAPDLPGFGASAAPSSPYNATWFAAWVEAFQATTGSRGAVVIGNSLGGRVALEAGLSHPKSVRAVVLLTPSPAFRGCASGSRWCGGPAPSWRGCRCPCPTGWSSRASAACSACPGGCPTPGTTPPPTRRSGCCARAPTASPSSPPPGRSTSRTPTAARLLAAPARAACPGAVHLGRPRPAGPVVVRPARRDSAARAPGQVVLEDCGHVPQFEHPQRPWQMVRGFLEHL